MAKLFISEERLDAWTADGKVVLDGETMTLKEIGRSFSIRPAVRFTSIAGSDPDAAELVGKVLDEAGLGELGAEHYMNSVILGDVAYDVQQGFLGDPIAGG